MIYMIYMIYMINMIYMIYMIYIIYFEVYIVICPRCERFPPNGHSKQYNTLKNNTQQKGVQWFVCIPHVQLAFRDAKGLKIPLESDTAEIAGTSNLPASQTLSAPAPGPRSPRSRSRYLPPRGWPVDLPWPHPPPYSSRFGCTWPSTEEGRGGEGATPLDLV